MAFDVTTLKINKNTDDLFDFFSITEKRAGEIAKQVSMCESVINEASKKDFSIKNIELLKQAVFSGIAQSIEELLFIMMLLGTDAGKQSERKILADMLFNINMIMKNMGKKTKKN
ncbi:MAG: hypothetical protein PHE73_08680 [Sulfurovaceae bacterium]|nr:hypothetical protein [Sulfurovaceae bacterium]